MPIQQMLLGMGAAKKTYIDDVFSQDTYIGNESARNINNGVNLSSKGGLVWVKSRNDTHQHHFYDTARGANIMVAPDADSDSGTVNNRITAFNSNGFTLGSAGQVNGTNAYKYMSYSFAKQPGFLDIVTYTGNGANNRSISHSLGSMPGSIWIKRLDDPADWSVYHDGFYDLQGSNHYYLKLNTDSAQLYSGAMWANASPTDTYFKVGSHAHVNQNNAEYIAYVWAGGSDRTTATSKSVAFDGSGDYLSTNSSSSDFTMGTGDFTIECWAYSETNSSDNPIFQISDTSDGFKDNGYDDTLTVWHRPNGNWVFCASGAEKETSISPPPMNVWYHVALVRNSGTTTLYFNGTNINSATDNTNYDGTYIVIGGYYDTSYVFKGKISNFRVVKGTAVYTSSFRPPTKPLTNITNTKLLCCNNDSVTGATVTPVTIQNENTTASIVTPFNHPNDYTFGENEEDNIISCGTYKGNGSSTGPKVDIGWEPQWLLIKNTNSAKEWKLLDNIRGIGGGAYDVPFIVNNTESETASLDNVDLTSTGFKLTSNNSHYNTNNEFYLYIAIRRPDGYTGKPAEAGTDVFAIDTGNSSSAGPAFDSNFAVDFALLQQPASAGLDWRSFARLTGTKSLATNTDASETTESSHVGDYNDGFAKDYTSVWQSWLWKRHAGFDVVSYPITASGGIRHQKHSLGKVPEMIWMKDRDNGDPFIVYHNGLNGGTNPKNYYLTLNSNNSQSNLSNFWGNSASDINATSFYIDQQYRYGGNHIALLFASVDGISKVGTYAGSNSAQSINCGFQPKFVIIKNENDSDDWLVFDTTRGWGSGDDERLKLNDNGAQSDHDVGAPTSTGFDLTGNTRNFNQAGRYYIFYAHA